MALRDLRMPRTDLSDTNTSRVFTFDAMDVKTLQNWEQQRRAPTGPAAALLKIVQAMLEMAIKALHP